MANVIEARVIQKIDTEQGWNANELILYKGEIALVGDPDRVYNIKVGNGVKKFRDLPYMVNYVNGLYTGVVKPNSSVPSGVNNVFLVSEEGTYKNFGGVVLPKDNLGIIYKNGNNFTIQLIPIVSEEKLQKYIDEKLVDSNLGFGGEIIDLNQSPNVQGMYIPKVIGVYPNFGNLEYNPIEGFTIFLYKDGQFSKITIPLNAVVDKVEYNNEAVGVSGKAVEKYAVKKVNTVAELRNIEGEYNGQVISLLGYYKAGDKEPLNYVWKDVQDEDDGGSVINYGNGSWTHDFKKECNVEDFGIKSNSQQDALSNSNILKYLIENNYKIYFKAVDYYFSSIEITNENVADVFLKGQSFTGGYFGSMNTVIRCEGDFLLFNKSSSTRPIINDIHFVNTNKKTGNCIKQIFPYNSIGDFFVNVERCNFYNWKEAVYTNGYMTSLRVRECYFGGNKTALYSELASNFSIVELTDFISNETACRISGYQTIIRQCQLSMYDSENLDGIKVGLFIYGGCTTIDNIYYEEYSYTPELMTPDKYIFIKVDIGGSKNDYLTIKETTFTFEDNITHLEVSNNFDNSIKIEGLKDWYIPKSVRFLNDFVGRGIEINNENIYFNDKVTLMNKRQFNITSNNSYGNNFGNGFKNFAFLEEDINGFDKIPNKNSSASFNNLIDYTHKSVVLQAVNPNANSTGFEINYSFSMTADSEKVYSLQLLLPDNSYKIIQSSKSIEVSTGVFKVFFNGFFKGDLLMTHNGALHIGFKDNIPVQGSFDGEMIVRNY